MNWKLKAKIQNILSILPDSFSYAMYYWIQRHFGNLKKVDPVLKLKAGISIWNLIIKRGYDPEGKVFFEIGTGRAPITPLAFWLMGAKNTITIDLNPYLKSEILDDSLNYIINNEDDIKKIFGSLLNNKRFNDLKDFYIGDSFSLDSFLDFCQIRYIAPGNASMTGLDEKSIDFHTSYTVLEHIEPQIIKEILKEGNRIIKDDGLFVHRINYMDHFTQSDKAISAINFLQYSDKEWQKYAGNKYMYMNRLRHDDFLNIFESNGNKILAAESDSSKKIPELLRKKNIILDQKYRSKSDEVLSILSSWIVSRKNT